MGITAAIATAAATVGSAAISSSAAGNAAKTQAQSAANAQATQLQMFNKVQQNLAPYNTAGQGALAQLQSLFGLGAGGSGGISPQATAMLENTPGYQFTQGQGIQALDRSAASRGLDLSGAQLKDAQAYGQGLATSNAWQPYVSQLSSLAGLGENAGAGVGNAAVQTGAGVANSQLAQGQATAAGQVSQGNILGSGLGQLNGQIPGLISSYGNNVTMPTGAAPNYTSSGYSSASAGGTATDDYFALSDRRAKTDIAKVGTTYEGLTVYRFRYKGGGSPLLGVMAQDVEKVKPAAVREIGGVKHVNLSQLASFADAA